ncbi:MAG: hypothetical protein PHX43_05260 [Alphaproteobacteria bacterium]|nr:hypothetical protein [Alphaproteobacteria bacterium]
MSKQYWHCDICGGNFDPGEKCDCEPPMMAMESDKSSYHIKKEIPVFGKTNELLVISADINKVENDTPCLTVFLSDGETINMINAIFGKEAEELYAVLTGLAKTVRDPHDVLESRKDAANR